MPYIECPRVSSLSKARIFRHVSSVLCFMQEFKRRRNMRRYLITSCFVLAVFALFSATQAQADTIDNFTYQDGGNTFAWELSSTPTILPANFLPGLAFVITDVSYSENDIPQNPASLIFSSDAGGGGLSFSPPQFNVPVASNSGRGSRGIVHLLSEFRPISNKNII